MNPIPLLSHVPAIREWHLAVTSIHCCCSFNYPLKSDGVETGTIRGDFCCMPHSLALCPYWRHYSSFETSLPSYSSTNQITYPWQYHITFRLAIIWTRNDIINSVLRLVRRRSELINGLTFNSVPFLQYLRKITWLCEPASKTKVCTSILGQEIIAQYL